MIEGVVSCYKRRHCTFRAISPFSRRVFKIFILQTRKNQRVFGKGLTLYHLTKKVVKFRAFRVKVCFGKNRKHLMGKRENADYQHFVLFQQCVQRDASLE